MKRVISFALLTVLAFSMTACGGQRSDTVSGDTEITDGITSEDTTEKEADFGTGDSNGEAEVGETMTSTIQTIEQTGWTNAVPSGYLAEAGEQGSVETLTYDTKNYAWDSSDIRKTTYVYLPYGYDEKDTETRDRVNLL